TKLLDYGGKKPVLVVPSLINRAHILDLDKSHSFVRALAKKGFRPLLVDWDAPGPRERHFSLDDYMKRLVKALNCAVKEAGGPVPVIGYCMGGVFAAALAQLAKDKVSKLVFLATPWDFHSGGMEPQVRRALLDQLGPWMEEWGELPGDVIQAFFVLMQPFAVIEKFCRFKKLLAKSRAVKSFVLLEDWVNDGVPLPKNVAKACFEGWYEKNLPLKGAWKVMGACIDPATIACPNLHVIPARDKIVPPASAMALARAVPDAEILDPPLGHVSMMGHPHAATTLWPQIFDWLAS
ncbi:MAG TPA: alpha/beta fold hydrolase, partial [Alphaproteobacteria bacterium]|nr:alpha/beta fold hydrolase [Alphaproteobacteria bacterium]